MSTVLEVRNLQTHFFTRAGVVKAVPVSPGSNVDKGDTLVVIE